MCMDTKSLPLFSLPGNPLPELLDASHRRLTVPVVVGNSEDDSCQRDPRSQRVLHST